MADELMRTVIKPFRYTGLETKLPHKDKEGKDSVSVIGDNIKCIPGQEIQGSRNTAQVRKTHETHDCHSKT